MNQINFTILIPHIILFTLSLITFFIATRPKLRFASIIATALFLTGGVLTAIYFKTDIFLFFRYIAWTLFAYAPATALAVSLVAFGKRLWLRALTALVIATSLGGLAYHAFFVEPVSLKLRRLKITSPKIKSPIKIAFMSDIQSDTFGDYEQKVWRALKAQKADIIILGGDYTHDWSETVRQQVRIQTNEYLRKIDLNAPLGVLAVQGNVDTLPWTEMFANTHVECFSSRKTIVFEGGLVVTLLGMKESFDDNLEIPPKNGFHIVVGHCPNFALGKVPADLMLAGHTHGGQIRLPFIGPLFTNCKLPRRLCDGKSVFPDGRILFVTRGAGLERKNAPRMRLFCPPEIIVFELTPSDIKSRPH